MLTKQDIVEKIAMKPYPQNEYWISAGAGLVMHGVKNNTRDIDMGCTSFLANMLIENGLKWQFLDNGTRKIEVDSDIEMYENWFADEVILIDNLCVASLQSIRNQKVKLNREKDWADIALIDKFTSAE